MEFIMNNIEVKHTIKNTFTEDNIISIIKEAAKRVDIHVLHKRAIRLNHTKWLNDPDEWKHMDYLIIGFHINSIHQGCVEIKYDSSTQTNYLECEIHSINKRNCMFDFATYSYQLAIKDGGEIVEEELSIYLKNTNKSKRILTYKTVNDIPVQATSVIVNHNAYGVFKSSNLSPNQTMILNPHEDVDIIYNKLKLTYYMTKLPTIFKDVTNHQKLSNILKKDYEKIRQYVTLLEMSTI